MKKSASLANLPGYWSNYIGGPYKSEYEVDTGLSAASVKEISDSLTNYPRDFHIHPKDQEAARAAPGDGSRRAALRLRHGGSSRLRLASAAGHSGPPHRLQDSQRSTFNQRHSVLVDTENEQLLFFPGQSISPQPGPLRGLQLSHSRKPACSVEYGYNRVTPRPWFYGRRNLATLPTARKSSSPISSSLRVKTSGGLLSGFVVDTAAG